MGDASDEGWQTVLPTSHHGVERLTRSQLEAYERQVLREWESCRGHWSGVGKHTSASDFAEAKKLHHRFRRHDNLGSGTYGIVEKVVYTHNNRSISLARKWIQYRRGRTIQMLREEANVMEKLDHEHIVKLVGTYCTRHNELYLLLWPVAICNLDNLFNDLDSLRSGHGDREDILRRLAALDVSDVRALERGHHQRKTAAAGRGNCPLSYLRQVVGCITHAVAYCHGANIRHLDLKPSNILLSPGKVYLADFGIARDVNDRDHTMTFGLQGTPKWRAPEICDPEDEWSMKAADVYSLGLVLLNIATVLYGGELVDFDRVVDELNPRTRAQKLSQYYPTLEAKALATQEVQDVKARTFAPKHIAELTSRMLSVDPSQRPHASQADAELVELGGIEQIYHSPCCKRSSRFVTERIDMRYRVVADERDRLQADVQRLAKRVEALEGKDETYEERLRNERRVQAQNVAHLQEQLDKERRERSRLEGLLAQGERRQRQLGVTAGIPRPGAGGLMIRSRPHAHHQQPPLQAAEASACAPSASAPVGKPLTRPLVAPATLKSQPTYSQAAAGKLRSPSVSVLRSPAAQAVQNGVGGPTGTRDSPTRALITAAETVSGIPSPSPSPNPNATGFSLRSRGSGSRLPRLVNPSTPIRSGTPSLQRDPSLTDSTQYSMSSSVFSRLSQQSRDSESAAGSPALGEVTAAAGRNERRAVEEDDNNNKNAHAEALDRRHPPLGADNGLGIISVEGNNLDATVRGKVSITDHASVVSSSGPAGTASPVLTASALSSPRSVKAELHPVVGAKVPALPTGKSWADVARR
ncbi:kinase-like domain-containing protein [Coniochaeta sp. 2T2.1]|nr:kinase-like domain-containing protein [Coniochaeta sp. 2T2.1]